MITRRQEIEAREYEGVPQELHDLWPYMDDYERSDALLSYHEVVNDTRGKRNAADVYTDKQLENRRRHELSNYDMGLTLFAVAEQDLRSLIERDMRQLAKMADFTEGQYAIWCLNRQGLKNADVARALQVSDEHVCQTLSRCDRKLKATMLRHPWWGWLEVYWSEVHR